MIALFLIPIYLLLNYYILRWILKWMGACYNHFKSRYFRLGFDLVFFFFSTTPLTSFLIRQGELHRILKILSNIWFGVLLYAILCIVTADLIRILIKYTHLMRERIYRSRTTFVISGTITLLFIISFSVHGILHARHLFTTSYQVTIDKEAKELDSLRVVLISDLHLGYSIGEWDMKQMVNRINEQHPDLVVITGDVFDNDFDAIKNPDRITTTLKELQSTYGVYACYGNHDLDEPILAGFTFSSSKSGQDTRRMEQFFKDADIKLLQDDTLLIDDSFYLIGRKDVYLVHKADSTRLRPDQLTEHLDKEKPILVMDHQPKEYQELADAGVDLDLSGHTHDGQLFPGNLTIKLMWENACGYLKKDNMHTIVTSGVGVWGPDMRVGTKSEIVVIDVSFRQKE